MHRIGNFPEERLPCLLHLCVFNNRLTIHVLRKLKQRCKSFSHTE